MAWHFAARSVSRSPATPKAWSAGNSKLVRAVVLLGALALVLAFIQIQYSEVAPQSNLQQLELEDGLAGDHLAKSKAVASADLVLQVNADSSRDEMPSANDGSRGDTEIQNLFLQVADHKLSNGLPVRVELLFGQRPDLRAIPLFLDRNGLAAWPGASQSPRPWFVDFAFPTVQAAGRRLTDDAEHAELVMMPTCVLDIEVVELDGRATADPLTVRMRSTQSVWPMNRWHSLHMVNGRAQALAEAAGQRLEIQVSTASGRNAEAICMASGVAGEHLSVSIQLPSTDGLNVNLSGLPAALGEVDHRWLVELHSLHGETASGHRLSGGGENYVFFTPQLVSDRVSRWLVIAKSEKRPDQAYWGYRDANNTASMRPFQLLGTGRCLDALGGGLTGYHVDLTVSDSDVVLVTAVSDQSGNFRLLGPDGLGLPISAVLREAQKGDPSPVSLPASKVINFQFGQ